MEGTRGPAGAHATHCCARHGCKYAYSKCPVAAGDIAQQNPCQECVEELEEDGGLDVAYAMNALWDKAFTAGREAGYEQGHEIGYQNGREVGYEQGREG